MFSIFLGVLPCSCQGQDATAEDNAVEKKNRLGRTELHNAVCKGDEKRVQQLLQNRASVDAKDESGRTPLHLAASEVSGPTKIIKLLLEARAMTEAKDLGGLTPLNLACDSKCEEAVAVLRSEGSPKVSEGLTEDHIGTEAPLDVLHFLPKHMPAVASDANEITFEGIIKPSAEQCWTSFPGKFKAGWDALVNVPAFGDSVACVFLCDSQSGLGEHKKDPKGDGKKCYCYRIYGERADAEYKKFGYLIYVQKKYSECSDLERSKLEQKANAMDAELVFEDDDSSTRDTKEKRAKEKFAQKKTAAFGCSWYDLWFQRVREAVQRGQRLKVVFFPGEVMKGKVDMDALATADLWDGVGLGTSQKCEVATLEAMRKETGDPKWDYDPVDVTDFLISQFKEGDLVEALDADSRRWRKGRISGMTKDDRHTVRHTWNIICDWSQTEFQSEHLRPLVQHTTGFETTLQGFQDKKMLRSLEEFFNVQVKQVQRSWSNGRHSIAVDVNISNLRQAHSLRDKVLSGDLDLKVNDILSIDWQVGIDKSAFLTFYERSLLSLTDLTKHQNEVLQELRDAGTHEQGVIHLSAAAGAGKTFIAVKWVLDHLRMSSGKVLYIAPNKPLHMQTGTHHQDTSQVRVPVINGNQILFESATVELEPCQVKILDEAHCIFCADTDSLIQDRLKSYSARSTVLLSDLSQGSSTTFSVDRHYPNRHAVKLIEVVRSTQRIVAGALNFRLGESRNENVDSLGTHGPPIKTFLFEVQAEQDKMEEYAKHTIAAINYVIYHFPSINLNNRIALLVKDNDVLGSLSGKLRRHLQHKFAKRYCLVSYETSLNLLPSHLSIGASAQGVQQEQQIILDTVKNAKGLENLIVISIGLDAPIQGGYEDGATRSLLYQGITRAQLASMIVNEFMPDGWLAFLGCLRLSKDTFDKKAAFAETDKGAAAAMLKVKDSRREVAEAAKTLEEEPAANISVEPEIATQEPAVVKVLPTSVWDTDDNTIKAKITTLKFDPRFTQEDSEDPEQVEADEAAAAKYDHIAHAAAAGDLPAVRGHLRRDGGSLDRLPGGWSALHWAANNDHPAVVAFLMAKGAAVDVLDGLDRATPLHIAAVNGHVECAQQLLAAKASVDIKDSDGRTPLDVARQNGNTEVVNLLMGAA
ncbi:unnamed protein product [Cladocopium goreaui]|uniref:Helicase ATP-binding domain-containing protein n=1 Tax=Cladocopium goreaui TaxID=2562237 RepID=A0A9P1D8R6_9DINO|nr:unnamed protein product [Cladocopium goreaui]